MAAIISQMAANKRARKANKHSVVSSDKCVYTLPPFDPCFDPLVHNKYMKAMSMKNKHNHKTKIEARVREQKRNELKKIEEDARALSDLLSGVAILILGLCLIVALSFYIWIVLWDVRSMEDEKLIKKPYLDNVSIFYNLSDN